MFKKIMIILWPLLLVFSTIALADDTSGNQLVGLGGVAQNMMAPVSMLAGLVHGACFVIGGCFLFTAIVKYFEHRRSPMLVPMSTVVFLFIAGILLILLPFLSYFTNIGF